jgi:hypothetical protein
MDGGSEPLSFARDEVSLFYYLIHLCLVHLGMYNYCLSDLLFFFFFFDKSNNISKSAKGRNP